MSVSVAPTELLTTAVRDMLRSAGPSGFSGYDHRVPPTATAPYWLLLALHSPEPEGPAWSDDEADVTLSFQVDSVGKRRDQAQWLADRLRTAVIARTGAAWTNAVAVTGWMSADRRTTSLGGVAKEGSPRFELYVVRDQYDLAFTPA